VSAVLGVHDVTVAFGRVVAVEGVSFELAAGTVTGLMGPNGAGKTTLIDALTGFVPLTHGRIVLDGTDVQGLPPHERARRGLSRTFQSVELFEDLTVAENLLVAAEAAGDVSCNAAADDLPELGDRPATELSFAQGKQVALARALVAGPRVLLVDEPAAGLDDDRRRDLCRRLRRLAEAGLAVLVIDHDVEVLLGVCDHLLVMNVGTLIASGPPAEVRNDPKVVEAYLGSTAEGHQPATDAPPPTPVRAGATPVLRFDEVDAGYGERLVLRGLTLEVRAGEIVALLGGNTAGKTTALLAASGVVPVRAGTVEVLGRPVSDRPHEVARRGVGHVSQGRAIFSGLTARENLRLAARRRKLHLDDLLDLFPGLAPLLDRQAGQLSGGEQQLLALARAEVAEPQLLLVDELSLGLAPRAVEELMATLRRITDERGTAMLVVEQHLRLALAVADRAYVLDEGRVVLEGPAAELARRREVVEAAYLGGRGGAPPSS
jgi:branched-chain amino acid transport system ATP-binding protein